MDFRCIPLASGESTEYDDAIRMDHEPNFRTGLLASNELMLAHIST